MSGTINIAGTTPVDDPAYRYKMPRIMAKVEGRGNGIKTVLVNVVDLGASLNREPPEITKFFGCELGSQTKYEAETDRAIVNGAHNAPDLQNHLSRYIEAFVLCKNCRLPETYYKIKHGIISQKCNACGSIDPVDMTHKLTTFILAQHKKAKELAAATEKKDKKDKKDKKKSSEEDSSETKAEKPKKEKKEKSEDGSEKKEKKPKKSKKSEDEAVEEAAGGLDEDESDGKATGKIINQ
jgi:translation initiation factor 5